MQGPSKIPQALLEKFKCAKCDHYLSIAPIAIGLGDRRICGRCPSNSSARCQLYEELATLHLFPCSYQPQGCLYYLKFNEIDHEKSCVFRTHHCPVSYFSVCNWRGTTSQIFQHYQRQHRQLVLNKPSFTIDLTHDFEIYKIIKIYDFVLLLQAKSILAKNQLWFNSVNVGGNNKWVITYRIKLTGGNGRTMELEHKNPSSFNSVCMTKKESLEVNIDGLIALLRNSIQIECHWYFTWMLQNSCNCIWSAPNCKNCNKKSEKSIEVGTEENVNTYWVPLDPPTKKARKS